MLVPRRVYTVFVGTFRHLASFDTVLTYFVENCWGHRLRKKTNHHVSVCQGCETNTCDKQKLGKTSNKSDTLALPGEGIAKYHLQIYR